MKLRFWLQGDEDCDLMGYVTTFAVKTQKTTVKRMKLTAKERNCHYV